jgi:hypothetical protein
MPPEANATEISIKLSMRNFNLNLLSVAPQGSKAVILECRARLTHWAGWQDPETGDSRTLFVTLTLGIFQPFSRTTPCTN